MHPRFALFAHSVAFVVQNVAFVVQTPTTYYVAPPACARVDAP